MEEAETTLDQVIVVTACENRNLVFQIFHHISIELKPFPHEASYIALRDCGSLSKLLENPPICSGLLLESYAAYSGSP